MHSSKFILCVLFAVIFSQVSDGKNRGKATKKHDISTTTVLTITSINERPEMTTTTEPTVENVTEIEPENKMRAVVLDEFGPPTNLTVKYVRKPEPGLHQVQVRLKAAGINFVDTQLRSGQFTPSKLPKLPAILGKEGAGVIEKLGLGVYDLKVGQKVVCCFTGTGAYAEYVVCNITHVVPFPDTLTFNQAATLYVSYFTAYRALVQKAKVKRNESVYIHGATGGFGIAAVQIAKNLGCTVTATYGADKGRKLLKSIGADFSHTHREPLQTVKFYQNHNESGWDVILETVAHKNLAQSTFSVKRGTRIVVVGSIGTVKINPIITQTYENQIIGVMLSKMNINDFSEAAEYLKQGMEEGWVKPIIDRTYKMHEIAKAHKEIVEKTETLGRYVLEID